MVIIRDILRFEDLKQMAAQMFGDMVKAVVDVDRELMAVDAELHADLEALLLDDGSERNSLWGINLYPELAEDQLIEFDSMINVRPSQGNRSRGIVDETIRSKVVGVVGRRLAR